MKQQTSIPNLLILATVFAQWCAGQSFPVNPNAAANCVVQTDNDLVYSFTQYNLPPLLGVFPAVGPNNVTEYFSVIVQLCSRVDLLVGNASAQTQVEWMGWNHGSTLAAFEYGGLTPTVQPSFAQNYTGGDTGYRCASGRNASVSIVCHTSPDAAVCGGTGCAGPNPAGGPPADYCICSAAYERLVSPCSLSVQVSLKCPNPTLRPAPGTLPFTLTPGGIAGITIISVLFVGALLCVAFVAYRRRRLNFPAGNPDAVLRDSPATAVASEQQALLPRSMSQDFQAVLSGLPDTIEDPAEEPPEDPVPMHPRGSMYGTLS